jgi:hypothetical protein
MKKKVSPQTPSDTIPLNASLILDKLSRIEKRLESSEDVTLNIPRAAFQSELSKAAQELGPLGAQGNIGCAGKTASAEHEGVIARLLENHSNLQSGTHNLLDELMKKLEPILLNSPTVTSAAAAPIQNGYCPAGDVLVSRIEIQRSINLRIKELIFRITL